jgi:hypothetical protein
MPSESPILSADRSLEAKPRSIVFNTAAVRGFLYHGSLPGGGEAVSPFGVWGIKVPTGRIKSSLVPGRDLKPIQIPSELPAMRLIVQYLNSFTTVAASEDPDVHEAFGTHLVDLLMLIVGAGRNSLELIKGRGLKAETRARHRLAGSWGLGSSPQTRLMPRRNRRHDAASACKPTAAP